MTIEKLKIALSEERILQSAYENILEYAKRHPAILISNSLNELIAQEAWDEINDRFHKQLSFGTGGMRGRTIGKIALLQQKRVTVKMA